MQHFRGIEGLRGWLACAVMVAHWTFLTGLSSMGVLKAGHFIADQSVLVFIIISGFVITHLLLTKQEPYRQYIVRRFLRIAPLFYIAFAASLITAPLYWAMVQQYPWGEMTPLVERSAEYQNHLATYGYGSYIWTHLTLLHGAIPENILPRSPLMFLVPAWSLSLEWQFYLLAPLIIAMIRTQKGALFWAVIAIATYWAARAGHLGERAFHPSFLPMAGFAFALGIATRHWIVSLAPLKGYPLAFVVLFAAFVFMHSKADFYIALWVAMIPFLAQNRWEDPLSQRVRQVLEGALNSGPANWLGMRSYAIYIVHYPMIELFVTIAARNLHLTYWQMVAFTGLTAVPAVILVADILHRHVELRGIALGRRIAGRLSSRVPATQ